MKIDITTKESNMICDPLRFWKKCGKNATTGKNVLFGILGLINFALETPLALLEALFFRLPVVLVRQNLKQEVVKIAYTDRYKQKKGN